MSKPTLALSCALAAFALAPAPAAADPVHAVALDPTTNWQPLSGAYGFTITPALDAGVIPSVSLCPNAADDANCVALTVQPRASDATTPSVSSYTAALPAALSPAFKQASRAYYAHDFLIPNDVFRPLMSAGFLKVEAQGVATAWLEVGVTSRSYAMFLTLVAVLLAAWTLSRFARRLGVPGARQTGLAALRSAPLKLIASSNGFASLSQFQIMLWTFVIGGGAFYVVALNGSLIPISAGTLALLGISGAAAVLTEVKNNMRAGVSGASMDKPKGVGNLNVHNVENCSDLLVTWTPPPDRAPIAAYVVEYKAVAKDGEAATSDAGLIGDIRECGVRLVGLAAQKTYHVNVWATNAAGDGDDTDSAPAGANLANEAKTGEADTLAADAYDLHATLNRTTESAIALEWRAPDATTRYDVQFRRADSRDEWRRAPPDPRNPDNASAVVKGLDSGVLYQFRVRKKDEANGWSRPATASTIHIPRWSDLVIDANQPAELDVSRVQMLIFTVISAIFVTLKIADSGAIPDIPTNYVVLMGISNTVYITTKYVRR
ncbi:MAG: fibronectin type III domain-containing protein [Pseudomonadota bacterium]|nr:fibronectin type III domain-containing protein [Pseudomonadota bacterium]